MSVRFKNNFPDYMKASAAVSDRAIGEMAVDIERLSKMQVPHDTGELQRSITHRRKGDRHFIVEADKVYAARWEFTNPKSGFKKGRKSRYMRDPLDTIGSKSADYLRRALNEVRV
jgi:hypothetical protein